MTIKNIRIRFWRWAHDRAEALWHWIYYHRVPEGVEQRKKSRAAREKWEQGWNYSFEYRNSQGSIPSHSDGIRILRTGSDLKNFSEKPKGSIDAI